MSKLAHSNQETMDKIARDTENDRPDEPPFFHATPNPHTCQHDFGGWRDLHNDEGQVCGGETVCTKCGMGAMAYSLSTGF